MISSTKNIRDLLIIRSVAQGKTYAQVADNHGITKERVRQIARENGLPSRNRGATTYQEFKPAFNSMMNNGGKIADFAKSVGVSLSHAYAVARVLNQRFAHGV